MTWLLNLISFPILGGTEEYEAMMWKVLHMYPNTKVIVIGFSMGGNIVTKYLGERALNGVEEDRIILGISICQGYDAVRYVSDESGLYK